MTMIPDDSNDPGPPDGLEEKAANLLNATMVTAIGLAIGVMGVWVLWRFGSDLATAREMGAQGTRWMKPLNAVGFIIVGVLVARSGVRMFRSKRL
tara:strand:- start:873 stop:1157 length:285 start_codon:yes stop_codon:yes gene_type:complete